MVTDGWSELRREAEGLLGRRVNDVLWIAVRKRYDDRGPQATMAEDLAQDLSEVLAEAGEAGRRERPDSFVGRKETGSRTVAISTVFAAMARQLQDVREFRERSLPEGLIAQDECATWIFRRHVAPEREDVVLLEYAPPGAEWVHRLPVNRTDLLGELAQLSDSLADMFSWQPQQATTFVLSDAVPIVAPIRGTTRIKGPVAAASRIILEVDPWTDPRYVQAVYSELRKGGDTTRRFRPLGDRALALARFIAEHPDESEAKRLRAWNRAHPEWKYADRRSFVRAHRDAWERLLDPKIDNEMETKP